MGRLEGALERSSSSEVDLLDVPECAMALHPFPQKSRISHKQNNNLDPSKIPPKIHALRIQPSLGLSVVRDLDFHALNVTEGVQWGQWPILSARLRHPRAVPNRRSAPFF